MIFESDLERKAFKYICDKLSNYFGNEGCNDLEQDMVEAFKGQTVKRSESKDTFYDGNICFDSDIIQWLKNRINGECQ